METNSRYWGCCKFLNQFYKNIYNLIHEKFKMLTVTMKALKIIFICASFYSFLVCPLPKKQISPLTQ